jgi:hypothetical protein
MVAIPERAELDRLLELNAPLDCFATIDEQLKALAEADRPLLRAAVMEALAQKFEGKPIDGDWLKAILQGSSNFIRAAEEVRPQLSDDHAGEPKLHEDRLCALLVQILSVLPKGERGSLLAAVLPELEDVSLLCGLFRAVDSDWSAERAARNSEDTYFGTHTATLRNALLARVESLAASAKLWAQIAPASLLWFWWACGQEQQVYVFTKTSMRDAKALPGLLDTPVGRVKTKDGPVDVIQVRRWSRIIDFHTLETRALELSMSGASRAERGRARRFLDAYANGKSELFR